MHPTQIDLSPLARAIDTLAAAVDRPPANDLERDGVIQRFEYTFELCWKSARRVLLALGRADAELSGSPRPILREALREGFISDIHPWFEFLDARNRVSHTYNEAEAVVVHRAAVSFAPHATSLLASLQEALRDATDGG